MRRQLLILGGLLLFGCAQQVAPTGGPKDTTPPTVLYEKPANLSSNFEGQQVEIAFDEYIQLRSASDEVVISPPILKSPSYQFKKKSLIVKFDEAFAENTTYTINFGEAIRDNNEGNILQNYTYVFSTGNHLDSMQVKGQLTYVLTGKPEADALVMLYKNDIDSLPLDTIPDYFTRTDENGHYHIKNVANQSYKIFALKDENANYKFDVPTEKIGFLDTLIKPFSPPKPAVPDSSSIDSLAVDSLTIDSLGIQNELPPIPSYNMTMFVEDDTTQFLKKAYCDQYGKLVFVYNLPVKKFDLNLSGFSSKKQWRLEDVSPTQDSVTVWITDVVPDTMNFLVSVNEKVPDTVELVMKERPKITGTNPKAAKAAKGRGASRGRKELVFGLTASSIPGNNRPPKPGTPFTLVWNHPILGLDISRMKLYEDSVRVKYDITTGDKALRRFDLTYKWQTDKRYRLLILDSAFTDMYGLWNDTIEFSFVGADKDMFGSLSLKVTETPTSPILVELLTSAGKLVDVRSVAESGVVKFQQLDAGNYSVDVIRDLNGNGKWDSGRYSEKLQPEPIRVIQAAAEIRANWDFELEWDPNAND